MVIHEECYINVRAFTLAYLTRPGQHKSPRPSSSVLSLSRPPTSSSPRITNRSFRYASPHLWNQLPVSFRQPRTRHPADDVTLCNSPSTCSPLSPSITHSLFHSRLKTHLFHNLFHHILLAPAWTAFSDYTGPDLFCSMVFHFCLIFSFLFWVVR